MRRNHNTLRYPTTPRATGAAIGALVTTGDGAPTFTACFVDATGTSPAHLNIVTNAGTNTETTDNQNDSWLQGDVNLTAKGVASVIANGIPTCASQGASDVARTYSPDLALPPAQSELRVPPFAPGALAV
ncbi:MAG TPA: hypothetical protein VIR03_01305 [Candidatus Saccharimonadales bacterium]